MVTSPTVSSAFVTSHYRARVDTEVSAQQSGSGKIITKDSVQFSSSARHISGSEKLSIKNPAMLSSEEVQVKTNLSRVFMEALFGKEGDQKETAKEELVRTVVEDPAANRRLDSLV